MKKYYDYNNPENPFRDESFYNNNNRKKNESKSDVFSWIIIAILMMGGGWPFGIGLLLLKLFGSDTPKKDRRRAPPLYQQNNTYNTTYNTTTTNNYYENGTTRVESVRAQKARETFREFSKSPSIKSRSKTATLLTVIGGFMAFLGLIMVGDAIDSFIFWDDLLFSVGWLASGVAMVASGIGIKKADARYARYMAVIGSNPAVNISSLATKLGIKEKTVHKDLQRMVDKGYFGNSAYVNEELGYLFTSGEADEELRKVKEAAMKKVRDSRETTKKQEVTTEKQDGMTAKQEKANDVDYYESIIRQIRDVNERIAHPVMSEKIYKLETTTRQIFRAVQDSPEKRSKIEKFLSYYLPTTLKLLESYAKLEKTGLDGENISQSKASIESAMDSIVGGFEHQLDELYKADVMDIETDIDVMTKMMNRENVSGSEFKVAEFETPVDTRTQFEKDFNVTRTSDGTISYGGSAAQTK